MTKERAALIWHLLEFLLLLSVIGVFWSTYHETRRFKNGRTNGKYRSTTGVG
jgi:hypothetical protein